MSANEAVTNSCVGRGLTSPESVFNASSRVPTTWSESITRSLFNRYCLLQSTAFRMGLLFWFLFTSCFGLASVMVYKTLQDRTLERIDQSITARFDSLQEAHATDGIQAVIGLLEARSRTPMETTLGYNVSSAEGELLAGNVEVLGAPAGWANLSDFDLGYDDSGIAYRFYTGQVGQNVVSLGTSLKSLEELQQETLTCLLWATLGSTILALITAAFYARRAHRRITAISKALDGVATGNLNSRLPVGVAGDDIDHLSGHINRSLDRLKYTVDSMRQVSTDIAHDLKTPLNRLFISIEEAATRSRAGRCVGKELEFALGEAQAINGTFEALLRIAQIEAGARKSQFALFDLAKVMRSAGEIYTAVAEDKRQTLTVQLGETEELFVMGDRDLVMQMVVNLIENALHHCEPGTRIDVKAGKRDEEVWFSISDSGPGIPSVERSKVFQRLYRLERSRTTTGTGLGLSLVAAVAELHGGTINLEDNHPGVVAKVQFAA